MICVNCFLVRRAQNSSNAYGAGRGGWPLPTCRDARFLMPFDNLRGGASVSSPVPIVGRMTSSVEVTEEVA
jgi:hypothetical protein